MKRIPARVAVAAFAVPFVAAATAAIWIGAGPQHRSATAAKRLSAGERAQLANLDIPFIENRGQLNGSVAFYAPTFAGTAFVTRNGALVLSLPARPGKAKSGGWTLVESPRGSQVSTVRGVRPAATRVNIFQGTRRSHWRGNLRTYAEVSMGPVWSGVDYSLRAHGNNVERIFTVQPGADASAIRMQVAGVRGLRVSHGLLVAETGRGPVTLSRPRAWQRIHGKRLPVNVSYTASARDYGFRLGHYDHDRPVVIDPVIRTTYLGGPNGSSNANAMQEVAANGNIYLAGTTTSPSFPGTSGGAQTALAGSQDAFVAELSPDLSQLMQATYLGGSGNDSGAALAIAPAGTTMAGDVYVAGTTQSSDFPGAAGGAQPTCGGGSTACANTGDAFVAVLSPDLKTLIQSSYLGGSSFDNGDALAIAPSSAATSGDVYLAGRTLSATDFPFVSGGAQPQAGSSTNYQGFVARFNPGLTSVSQASYLGGSGVNEAYAITVAPSPATSGLVYVAGDTSSTDFPCTNAGGPPPAGGACASSAASGAQASSGGAFDAFAAELNPGLTQLLQATYLGGADVDSADVIRIAPNGTSQAGQVFIGGLTYSASFPGVSGGAQPIQGGSADGFVARLSPTLTSLGAATYLGGTKDDNVQALAFTGSDLYAAGTTSSTDFPCTSPKGPNPTGGACVTQHAGALYRYGGGTSDGFVALLGASLSSVAQGSYMGGKGTDSVTGLSLAPAASTYAGDVVVGGATTSADLPATSGAAQPAATGSGSAFAAAITPDLQSPEVTLNASASGPSSVTEGQDLTMTVTVTNASTSNDAADVHLLETLNSAASAGKLSYVGVTASQGSCIEQTQFVDCSFGTVAANGGTATMTLKVNAKSAGKVESLITASSSYALTPGSNYNITHTTTINPKSSSGGGGAIEWPALIVLGMLGLFTFRRKRLAPIRG